jgi:hypothetical protein
VERWDIFPMSPLVCTRLSLRPHPRNLTLTDHIQTDSQKCLEVLKAGELQHGHTHPHREGNMLRLIENVVSI